MVNLSTPNHPSAAIVLEGSYWFRGASSYGDIHLAAALKMPWKTFSAMSFPPKKKLVTEYDTVTCGGVGFLNSSPEFALVAGMYHLMALKIAKATTFRG